MGLHSIHSTVFSAPTTLMTSGHPFAAPAYRDIGGIPMGIDIHSREILYIDLVALKLAGVLHSMFGLFLGPKGYGKSATMKMLAFRLMALASGYHMTRVAINDFKPEGKDSEYSEFTAACRSKKFEIGSLAFNPFEAKLFQLDRDKSVYELGILSIAETIVTYLQGGPLIGDQPVALRVAVYDMLKHHDELLWSVPLLFKLLRSITDESIILYYDELDTKITQQLTTRMESVEEPANRASMEASLGQTMYQKDNADYQSIKSAGWSVATQLHKLQEGHFGSMIGIKNSYYDLLTQRVVTRDWRGVKPEAETLMRIIDTGIRINAIEHSRQDLLPHIELDDEKHRSLRDLVYARADSHLSEIARGTQIAQLSATHRLSSLRRGGVDSEQWALGDTIISNMGFVAIGRQDNRREVLDELQERYALSDSETRELPRLPRYTFVIKLGEEEPVRTVRMFATPLEMDTFLGTESAAETLIDRPDVMDPDDLRRFAQENGLVLLGLPS